MKGVWSIIFLVFISMSSQRFFKDEQLRFDRVKAAEDRIGLLISKSLVLHGIHDAPFELYMRAFKKEGELELWVKSKEECTYRLLKTYAICASSGILGPKRKQGDLQVPEGFYTIDRFNPLSTYHLSLGLDYPNASDKFLSDPRQPGGDIFIHGNCVTIGCLPMGDEFMEEIYLYAIEGRDRGQARIPVHLFPMRMSGETWSAFKTEEREDAAWELYASLEKAYTGFQKEKILPQVKFLPSGRHEVSFSE